MRTNNCQQLILKQILMQQSVLQTENYQLKNEITDLKNAFDLNRDILKILSSYDYRADPHLHLLMQIITRLTTLNNQAMLNGIDYIKQKNVLKDENLKLNIEISTLQSRLQQQIERNRLFNVPNESKLLMQEQFNSLSKELMAANEERIIKEHEIEYWKDKYIDLLQQHQLEIPFKKQLEIQTQELREKIKRRYNSNHTFKQQIQKRELQAQNRRLKLYIEELEYRLLLFVRAYRLQDEAIGNGTRIREPKLPVEFQEEREEIRLLKYALNDIHVERKQDQYILTITQRFKQKDTMNNQYFRERRSMSWPNHLSVKEEETQTKQKTNSRMEERYY